MQADIFQQRLLHWFDQHGRKDLPWQQQVSPYRVWVSEIMLQQTQVTTVIPYFNRFMLRFPDIESLARASQDDVLAHWSGLGYYARARNLHKTAQIIVDLGQFPNDLTGLTALPGIGLSTAGAILSIAFKTSQPILDGNVKRVLTRFKAIAGWPGESQTKTQLWQLSAYFTPVDRVADFTQAIMDLGATLCTRKNPACVLCPLQEGCSAYIQNKVAQFPAAKPSKRLPVKQVVLLLLVNQFDEFLLEKRPSVGVWGGLWSLPEFDNDKAALAWCQLSQIDMVKRTLLPTQRHTFSHFHLDYSTLIIKTAASQQQVMAGDSALWYKPTQIHDMALATPIKVLLQQQFIKQE
ncbi:MAG: A/G-specific adenine glycosylase [Methylococcaceae bacterium]|jgi:A/G-specific adenine glycosylase